MRCVVRGVWLPCRVSHVLLLAESRRYPARGAQVSGRMGDQGGSEQQKALLQVLQPGSGGCKQRIWGDQCGSGDDETPVDDSVRGGSTPPQSSMQCPLLT
eukprot:1867480-Rhodomonas_salina.3